MLSVENVLSADNMTLSDNMLYVNHNMILSHFFLKTLHNRARKSSWAVLGTNILVGSLYKNFYNLGWNSEQDSK
jgi:hypothetical protein